MSRLLDTSALLAHFRNETGAEQVQALFEEEGAELLLCSLTLPEFARRICALGASLEETRNVVRRYRHIADEVVSVDANVAELAFNLIIMVFCISTTLFRASRHTHNSIGRRPLHHTLPEIHAMSSLKFPWAPHIIPQKLPSHQCQVSEIILCQK